MNMASPPIKISLKNTTKMTLNSRFTTIMKSRPATSPQTVRAQASTAKMASEKNRRLTQQMERRPAVEKALGLRQQHSPQKQSVLDRLGTKPTRGRGRINAALKRFPVNRSVAGRLGLQQNNYTRGTTRGTVRGRGRGRGVTSFRGGPLSRTYYNSSNRGNNKNLRGNTRGRGGTRGRGRGRGRGGKPVNREQLDTDLDSYMSKTKTSMDAELDAYMANAGK